MTSRNVSTVSTASAATVPADPGAVEPTCTLCAHEPQASSTTAAPITAPASCAVAYASVPGTAILRSRWKASVSAGLKWPPLRRPSAE